MSNISFRRRVKPTRSSRPNRSLKAERLETRQMLAFAITGTAWQDVDADGLRDANEPAMQGTIVRAYQSGELVGSATTSSNGAYQIMGIPEGNLTRVVVTSPFGYRLSVPNAGSGSNWIDSDFDPDDNSALLPANTATGSDQTLNIGWTQVDEQIPVELGEQVTLLADGQLQLSKFPVAGVSVKDRTPAGLELFVTAGGASYVVSGTDIENLTSKTTVLTQQPNGGFDRDGAWIGGSYRDGNALYAFYTGGDRQGMPIVEGSTAFYMSIGVAVSYDNGQSFDALGRILTSSVGKDLGAWSVQGLNNVSVVPDPTGRYLYLYYTDHTDSMNQAGGVQIAMARADLSIGVGPGDWKKFYNGSFSEPGLGGKESFVVTAHPGAGHALNPQVSYSAKTNRMVMVYAVNDWKELGIGMPTDSGIYIAYSSDGIHWTPGTQIIDDWALALTGRSVSSVPSIVWDDADGELGKGWLVYSHSSSFGSAVSQSQKFMVGRRISLGQPVTTALDSELLAYDGFGYTAGSLELQTGDGSFGFSSSWASVAGQSNVEAWGLDHASVVSASGGHVVQNRNSRIRRRLDVSSDGPFAEYLENRSVTEWSRTTTKPLIGKAGTELYISFIQNADAYEGYLAFELQRADYSHDEQDRNRPLFIGVVEAEAWGKPFVLGSYKNGYLHDLAELPGPDNQFYVLKLTFGEGNNDRAELYRNPTPGAEPTDPIAVLESDFAFDRVTFANIQGNRVSDIAHRIDELRFSTTYQAVFGERTNHPPTVTVVNNQLVIDEDSQAQSIQLVGISDGDFNTQPLRVTAVSSDTGLIANPTVNYAANGHTASVVFSPQPDQYGEARIIVTVEDGGNDGNLDTPNDNAITRQTIWVTVQSVNDPPIISNLSVQSGSHVGEAIQFVANASDIEEESLTYQWNFGDQTAPLVGRDLTTVSHLFNQPGTYTVTLVVNDSDNASASRSIEFTVAQLPSLADAGGPYVVTEGRTIELDASGSRLVEDGLWRFFWDFNGDGVYDDAVGINALFSAAHIRAGAEIEIGLQIVNDGVPRGMDTAVVRVVNAAPVATAGGPYQVDVDQSVQLTASGSSDFGNGSLSFDWDFDGDGEFDDATGVDVLFSAVGLDPGSVVEVRVRVTDEDGASDTATALININKLASKADAGGPYVVTEGETIQLDASGSFNAGTGDLIFQWDFDNDGEFDDASGATPQFSALTLDGPGEIDVSVRIVDSLGNTSIDSATISLLNAAPVVTEIIRMPVTNGRTVRLEIAISDQGRLDTHVVSVDWGDDTGIETFETDVSSVVVSHLYQVGGQYEVAVRVADDDGGQSQWVTIDTQAGKSELQNAVEPTDVNADGKVTASDALAIINRLSQSPASGDAILVSDENFGLGFLDVNGDGRITAADALEVINRLAEQKPSTETAGELTSQMYLQGQLGLWIDDDLKRFEIEKRKSEALEVIDAAIAELI